MGNVSDSLAESINKVGLKDEGKIQGPIKPASQPHVLARDINKDQGIDKTDHTCTSKDHGTNNTGFADNVSDNTRHNISGSMSHVDEHNEGAIDRVSICSTISDPGHYSVLQNTDTDGRSQHNVMCGEGRGCVNIDSVRSLAKVSKHMSQIGVRAGKGSLNTSSHGPPALQCLDQARAADSVGYTAGYVDDIPVIPLHENDACDRDTSVTLLDLSRYAVKQGTHEAVGTQFTSMSNMDTTEDSNKHLGDPNGPLKSDSMKNDDGNTTQTRDGVCNENTSTTPDVNRENSMQSPNEETIKVSLDKLAASDRKGPDEKKRSFERDGECGEVINMPQNRYAIHANQTEPVNMDLDLHNAQRMHSSAGGYATTCSQSKQHNSHPASCAASSAGPVVGIARSQPCMNDTAQWPSISRKASDDMPLNSCPHNSSNSVERPTKITKPDNNIECSEYTSQQQEQMAAQPQQQQTAPNHLEFREEFGDIEDLDNHEETNGKENTSNTSEVTPNQDVIAPHDDSKVFHLIDDDNNNLAARHTAECNDSDDTKKSVKDTEQNDNLEVCQADNQVNGSGMNGSIDIQGQNIADKERGNSENSECKSDIHNNNLKETLDSSVSTVSLIGDFIDFNEEDQRLNEDRYDKDQSSLIMDFVDPKIAEDIKPDQYGFTNQSNESADSSEESNYGINHGINKPKIEEMQEPLILFGVNEVTLDPRRPSFDETVVRDATQDFLGAKPGECTHKDNDFFNDVEDEIALYDDDDDNDDDCYSVEQNVSVSDGLNGEEIEDNSCGAKTSCTNCNDHELIEGTNCSYDQTQLISPLMTEDTVIGAEGSGSDHAGDKQGLNNPADDTLISTPVAIMGDFNTICPRGTQDNALPSANAPCVLLSDSQRPANLDDQSPGLCQGQLSGLLANDQTSQSNGDCYHEQTGISISINGGPNDNPISCLEHEFNNNTSPISSGDNKLAELDNIHDADADSICSIDADSISSTTGSSNDSSDTKDEETESANSSTSSGEIDIAFLFNSKSENEENSEDEVDAVINNPSEDRISLITNEEMSHDQNIIELSDMEDSENGERTEDTNAKENTSAKVAVQGKDIDEREDMTAKSQENANHEAATTLDPKNSLGIIATSQDDHHSSGIINTTVDNHHGNTTPIGAIIMDNALANTLDHSNAKENTNAKLGGSNDPGDQREDHMRINSCNINEGDSGEVLIPAQGCSPDLNNEQQHKEHCVELGAAAKHGPSGSKNVSDTIAQYGPPQSQNKHTEEDLSPSAISCTSKQENGNNEDLVQATGDLLYPEESAVALSTATADSKASHAVSEVGDSHTEITTDTTTAATLHDPSEDISDLHDLRDHHTPEGPIESEGASVIKDNPLTQLEGADVLDGGTTKNNEPSLRKDLDLDQQLGHEKKELDNTNQSKEHNYSSTTELKRRRSRLERSQSCEISVEQNDKELVRQKSVDCFWAYSTGSDSVFYDCVDSITSIIIQTNVTDEFGAVPYYPTSARVEYKTVSLSSENDIDDDFETEVKVIEGTPSLGVHKTVTSQKNDNNSNKDNLLLPKADEVLTSQSREPSIVKSQYQDWMEFYLEYDKMVAQEYILQLSDEEKDETNKAQLEWEIAELKRQLKTATEMATDTKTQMEKQRQRTKQLVSVWRMRLQQQENDMLTYQAAVDGQMRSIASELLFLQGKLKREQSEVSNEIVQKDKVIKKQQEIIDTLLPANANLAKALKSTRKKMKDLRRKYKQLEENTQEMSDSKAVTPSMTQSNHVQNQNLIQRQVIREEQEERHVSYVQNGSGYSRSVAPVLRRRKLGMTQQSPMQRRSESMYSVSLHESLDFRDRPRSASYDPEDDPTASRIYDRSSFIRAKSLPDFHLHRLDEHPNEMCDESSGEETEKGENDSETNHSADTASPSTSEKSLAPESRSDSGVSVDNAGDLSRQNSQSESCLKEVKKSNLSRSVSDEGSSSSNLWRRLTSPPFSLSGSFKKIQKPRDVKKRQKMRTKSDNGCYEVKESDGKKRYKTSII